MRFWRKTLLVWIVMLAIPVQGVAAATMLFCGISHHRINQVADAGAHDAHGHSHEAPIDAAAAPPTIAEQADSGPNAAPTDAAQAEPPGTLSQSGCSACAVCNAGAAIPSSAPTISAVEIHFEAIAAKVAPQFGFVTDGPDRPPRLTLA